MTKTVHLCAVCGALIRHARVLEPPTLTREDAIVIRRQAKRGVRLRDIARAFSVSTTRVQAIVADPLSAFASV